MSSRRSLLFALTVLILFTGCTQKPGPAANQTTNDLARYQPVPYVKITHPDWSKNASIYRINTRQFTPEGTLRAAEAQIPRLKALGVTILWLTPIHPIGQKNRKGTLGSPYAVRDYLKVNPDLGTLNDLKHFVATAHQQGMYVILDWVANHTAWDNVLVTEHPEWYARNWKGEFRPTPWFDWGDIIDLDYSHPELRKYMTDALKYWVREADIDGYRCDVAGFVPVDFWNNARQELEAIKPVFMLAEWESRDLHKHDLGALRNYYAWNEGYYPPNIMRMTFVSNHDKNAWDGTEFERFGAGLNAAIVLSCVGE